MLNWRDYLDRVEGRAIQLSRAILRGIAAPDGEMSLDIQIEVARQFGDQLGKIADEEGEIAFIRCGKRALAWSLRDDLTPEVGIMIGRAVVALNEAPSRFKFALLNTDEGIAWARRYKEMIPA